MKFQIQMGLRILLMVAAMVSYSWAATKGFEIWVVMVLAAGFCMQGFNLHQNEEVLVGVVTPREDLFDEWVKKNSVPGEQYVQVSKEEDLGGFDRIEPGLCWEVLGNLYFKAKQC